MVYLAPFLLVASGAMMGAAFFILGYKFAKLEQSTEVPTTATPIFKRKSQQKKTPKSVSEFDQWKKEQAQAPIDPGLGG